MACFRKREAKEQRNEARAQREASRRIEAQLKEDKRVYESTYRLFLVGAGESGKSTLLKQARITSASGFSDGETRMHIQDIRKNIKHAIQTIVTAMDWLEPPVKLSDPGNQFRVDYILNLTDEEYCDFSVQLTAWTTGGQRSRAARLQEFCEHTKALWRDGGVKACYERSSEYHLIVCARYFLDKIDIVMQNDYSPSDQDVLRAKRLTPGMFEASFQIEDLYFYMFHVSCIQRHSLLKCISHANAIMFVVDSSSYNMVIPEDNQTNRLTEALHLFKSVFYDRFQGTMPLIIFLNKQDLLAEKILAGKYKLEDYFPEFAQYTTPEDVTPDPSEDPQVTRAKYFIRDEFLKITKARVPQTRVCFTQFTCAVDTANLHWVARVCGDLIPQDRFSLGALFHCFQ